VPTHNIEAPCEHVEPFYFDLSYNDSVLQDSNNMLLDISARRERSELVIGIVGAVGSNLGVVQDQLIQALRAADYNTEPIHLVELLHEIDRWESLPETPEEVRIEKHMNAGDEFRDAIGSDDALAVLGVGEIQKLRTKLTNTANEPAEKTAYILKSLKHPDEIQALREIYGPGCFIVAAYSPREARIQNLATKIARSHNSYDSELFREHAEKLVMRDQKDALKGFGQNVRQSFPLADVFLESVDAASVRTQSERFIQLILGNNAYTPTRYEYAMVHAQVAALRSGALGRQVGAVIATPEGQIVAAGTNEVPKFRGGQYWYGDDPDHRDISKEYDSSDLLKVMNVQEILERLLESWLSEDKKSLSPEERVKEVLPLLKGTRIMQPLEYGRAVHAEMAAIVDAAARGVSIRGCLLFTTTFPCHECARHIIAAGIERVVYIEPYPKSLAAQLHEDSIAVETGGTNRLIFQPFVGVAPRQYLSLFPIFGNRKTSDGKRIVWDKSMAVQRLQGFPESYIENEKDALALLHKRMQDAKLRPVVTEGSQSAGEGLAEDSTRASN